MQLLSHLSTGDANGTAKRVGMAGQGFGGSMHHCIHAQQQRPLQRWRRKPEINLGSKFNQIHLYKQRSQPESHRNINTFSRRGTFHQQPPGHLQSLPLPHRIGCLLLRKLDSKAFLTKSDHLLEGLDQSLVKYPGLSTKSGLNLTFLHETHGRREQKTT